MFCESRRLYMPANYLPLYLVLTAKFRFEPRVLSQIA